MVIMSKNEYLILLIMMYSTIYKDYLSEGVDKFCNYIRPYYKYENHVL